MSSTLNRTILSLDGGSSSLKYGVITDKGEIVHNNKINKPFNLKSFLNNSFTEILHSVFLDITKKYSPEYLVSGISGLDTPLDTSVVESKIQKFLKEASFTSFKKFFVLGDIELVLNLIDVFPRIALISGTGSNCVGEDKQGNIYKAGGLGSLLSDEGSGYFIGNLVLRAVVKDLDKRGPSTYLTKLVLDKLKIKSSLELKDALTKSKYKKRFVAGFSPLVLLGFKNNDTVSKEILDNSIKELFLLVKGVALQANLTSLDSFNLVLTGSIFSIPYIYEGVTAAVANSFPHSKIMRPSKPSFYGGYFYLKSKGLFYQ